MMQEHPSCELVPWIFQSDALAHRVVGIMWRCTIVRGETEDRSSTVVMQTQYTANDFIPPFCFGGVPRILSRCEDIAPYALQLSFICLYQKGPPHFSHP